MFTVIVNIFFRHKQYIPNFIRVFYWGYAQRAENVHTNNGVRHLHAIIYVTGGQARCDVMADVRFDLQNLENSHRILYFCR